MKEPDANISRGRFKRILLANGRLEAIPLKTLDFTITLQTLEKMVEIQTDTINTKKESGRNTLLVLILDAKNIEAVNNPMVANTIP